MNFIFYFNISIITLFFLFF